MSDQNKSPTLSLLDGLVTAFKYLIITLLVYFFIGAGWNGLSDWYARLTGRKPDDMVGERVGNRAFGIFCILITLQAITLGGIEVEGNFRSLSTLYLVFDSIFLVVTTLGFIYFWANMDRKD